MRTFRRGEFGRIAQPIAGRQHLAALFRLVREVDAAPSGRDGIADKQRIGVAATAPGQRAADMDSRRLSSSTTRSDVPIDPELSAMPASLVFPALSCNSRIGIRACSPSRGASSIFCQSKLMRRSLPLIRPLASTVHFPPKSHWHRYAIFAMRAR
jgi:hypothetical protein